MIILDDVESGLAGTKFNAGSKARNDIDQIYKEYPLYFFSNFSKKKYISRSLYFMKSLNQLKKESSDEIYLLQYPQYIINVYSDQLYKYLNTKKSIALIHDLNSLRQTPDDESKIHHEISNLNQFKVIISHNPFMTKWLLENGCTRPIINLNLFDYLCDDKLSCEITHDVSFAGNLSYEKSKFLYEVIEKNTDVSFQIFGNGWVSEKITSTNYDYLGSKKPEEITQCITSKYGLIWDGDSTESCTGLYGNYERYNNPHKLSMCMASDTPVIVWSQSAISHFVKKENIGVVVDNLNDLSSVINKVSDTSYQEMKKNCERIGALVRKGVYTKKAVDSAIRML